MNELAINLKLTGKTPLYQQIYEYIKESILDGRIPCGEKLPSTRALSRHLEVSRSTVDLAYEQLLSEGYIETKPRRGFFVSEIEDLYHLDATVPVVETNNQKKIEECKYKFSPYGVDLKSFPYNAWRKLSKEILNDDTMELFHLGDPKGEYSFRKAICSYLYQARGVACNPSQIIVGAGNDYILMLLGALFRQDDVIAVENPAYEQAYRLFRSLSYEVIPVEMDKSGMKVDSLKEAKADIAYVTPSHQYPTGIIMPVKRRTELLSWAGEREGRYIIEDDYDSEFRYKGKPIPALKGYDRQGKVIYLGTFSKSIAPSIRLSYVVLPDSLLKKYEKKCGFLSSTVSKVDQMIVQKFIEEGYYERHLNKSRALYKGRHDALIAGLKPLNGQCKISGENAGVHVVLTFKNGMTEEELVSSAKKEGVKVYGLSEYMIEKTKEEQHAVLVGYANMTEEQIREGCKILCKIWNRA